MVDPVADVSRLTQAPSVGSAGARGGSTARDRVRSTIETILPAITVDVVHLLTRDDAAVERLKKPVWMMAKGRATFAGEITFSTDEVIALAHFVGLSDLECWQLLAESVMRRPPTSDLGVTPLRPNRHRRPGGHSY